MQLRVIRSRRIHSDGTHNAFTGMTGRDGATFVTFRSAGTHMTYDGVIRVIASDDRETWNVVSTHSRPDLDLRDPKLTTFGDRVLMYCGARAANEKLQSFVSISDAGTTFGDLIPLQGLAEGEWLWHMKPSGDTLYGAAYATRDGLCYATLYSTADGVTWAKVSDFPVPANEVAIDFDGQGRLWALAREDHQGCIPALCTAEPPYTSFSSATRLPIRLQGPMLKRLDGACVIVCRQWDGPGRRNLRSDVFLLEDGGDLRYVRALPSGGDTSYASWLDLAPGRAVICYYSSHEHRMDVSWDDEEGSPDTAYAEHSTGSDIFLADVCYR